MPIGFAAIATGVSLAATAGSTAGSFIQAGKQRRQQKEAEAAAVKAMNEARARLDVNYYEGLSIAKEPFELAREQALVQGAMGVEAVREADQRGAAAGVGRIQMAQEQSAAATRADMSQQMQRLEEITAQEEARLAGQKASLDLAEAQGAQLAARDAQEASQQAMQQGLAGVVSLGTQVAALPELYGSKGQREMNKLQRTSGYNKASRKGQTTVGGFSGEPIQTLGFSDYMGAQIGDSNYRGLTDIQAKEYYETGVLPKGFENQMTLNRELPLIGDLHAFGEKYLPTLKYLPPLK